MTEKINSLESDKQNLQANLNELHEIRKLLYATGKELEDVLSECLENLGGSVEPASYGEEEYVLIFDNQEHLIEVKGVQKSVSLTHLRQLNDYLAHYEEDTGNSCKGILFGNAWRITPPEDRGSGDRIEFPDNVIRRSEKWEIALWSSVQFFELYCRFLANEVSGELVLRYLVGRDGYVSASQFDDSV